MGIYQEKYFLLVLMEEGSILFNYANIKNSWIDSQKEQHPKLTAIRILFMLLELRQKVMKI